MEAAPDDLAGVVDLFGALTRADLERAFAELAFKRGGEPPALEEVLEEALASYRLVAVEHGEEQWLVVGPTAFPSMPEGAEDLPHIMEEAGASVPDVEGLAAAKARFREDAARAIAEGDADRIETLLDVSYEFDVWGDVDLAAERERLEDAVPGSD
jgi:hypothetical protein